MRKKTLLLICIIGGVILGTTLSYLEAVAGEFAPYLNFVKVGIALFLCAVARKFYLLSIRPCPEQASENKF